MSIYNLTDIEFVVVDPESIKNNIITTYEALSGRKLYPADPVRLFLLAQASIIIQQQELINQTAKQTLLRYASGPTLDHKGADTETPRLEATHAIDIVRFSLSAPQSTAITIPEGTRVSAGDDVYFETVGTHTIAIGLLSIDVPVKCSVAGEKGNGYIAGQITTLVDPLPYASTVINLNGTSGGSDREDDESYRQRIYAAPSRFSVAGPREAYRYWAQTAHAGISDVHVHSPAPKEVEVVVLMENGQIPTASVLDAVEDVLTDSRIRPLTDLVTVTAPTTRNYTIDFEYWIDSSNASEAVTIQANVAKAVDDFVAWQRAKIGRNINPSELVRLVMNAGARRVSVASPTYTVIGNTEVGVIANLVNDVSVVYGGVEND